MEIVPVLDIRGGTVVHAVRGERASYAPVRSVLTTSSDPVAMLQAMFDCIHASGLHTCAAYVADLDAIVSGNAQWGLIERLQRASPHPLWVDAGLASAAAARAARARGVVPIVGSESLKSLEGFEGEGRIDAEHWILSLDRDRLGARDPAGILQRPELWPQRVIAMDLTRVGAALGGVGRWLEACMSMSAGTTWIAAGSVRHRQDLQALSVAGTAAALVATALHDGTLSS